MFVVIYAIPSTCTWREEIYLYNNYRETGNKINIKKLFYIHK